MDAGPLDGERRVGLRSARASKNNTRQQGAPGSVAERGRWVLHFHIMVLASLGARPLPNSPFSRAEWAVATRSPDGHLAPLQSSPSPSSSGGHARTGCARSHAAAAQKYAAAKADQWYSLPDAEKRDAGARTKISSDSEMQRRALSRELDKSFARIFFAILHPLPLLSIASGPRASRAAAWGL